MEKTFEKIGAVGAAALIASMGFAPAALAVNTGDVNMNIKNNNDSQSAQWVNDENLAQKWTDGTSAAGNVRVLKTVQAPAIADMANEKFTFIFTPVTSQEQIDELKGDPVTNANATEDVYFDINEYLANPNCYEDVTWDDGADLDLVKTYWSQGSVRTHGTRPVSQTVNEVGIYPIPENPARTGLFHDCLIPGANVDANDNVDGYGTDVSDTQAVATAITFTAEQMTQNADLQNIQQLIPMPEAGAFQHAGVYMYTIRELTDPDNPAYGHSAKTDGGQWIDAKETYVMRVYVVNTDLSDPDDPNKDYGLKIDAVTVEQLTETNNDPSSEDFGESQPNNVKVNPEDANSHAADNGTADDTTDDIENNEYPGSGKAGENEDEATSTQSGFKFLNTYLDTDNTLTISKKVTGDYANRTELFDFEIELEVPAYVPDRYVSAIGCNIAEGSRGENFVVDPRGITDLGTDVERNSTTEPRLGTIKTTAIDGHKIALHGIKLHDESLIELVNLPLGTRYTITELNTGAHYEGTSTFKAGTNATEQVGGNAGKNQSLTVNTPQAVDKAAAETTTIGDGLNEVVVTNQFDDADISPTGIVTQALPYLVLIAVPAAGLLYIAARRRKQED